MLSTPQVNANARIIALIVGGAFFMVLLDSSIIATSLPRMAQSFGVEAIDLSIGMSIYLLSVATFVPLSGWLSDRFGPRSVFLVSIIVFSLASVACGLASNLPEFIAARALQGLGGALMTPIGRVLVLRHAPKSELVKAMALITWPALTAPVIGPVLGGFITSYFSWRWNFLLNLPLGVLAFVLTWRLIPYTPPTARRAFDLSGFILSASALVSLIYGLESFTHQWLTPQWSGLLLLTGAALSGTAIYHFRRTDAPLLNLQPFTVQTFAMASIWAGSYIRIGINATPFLLPLLLQLIFDLSPLQAGGYLFVYFLGNLGMKTVTTSSLRLFGFRRVLLVNGLLCGFSIAVTAYFDPVHYKVPLMMVLFFAGLTRSMQYTALNALGYADLPTQLHSSAATLGSMLMQLSMVLGIALSALLLNASQWFAQRETLQIQDFQLAFVIMGVLVMLASLVFLQLPRNAGAEISGYEPNRPLAQRFRQK